MSRRKLGVSIVLALMVVFGLAAVALARGDGGPRTDPVTASFSLQLVEGKFRACTGEDGPYSEVRATFKGSIVSPDPRLTGEVELRARVLHNDASEYGTAEGIFLVRDSGTHTVKVHADLHAVESPGVPGVHGFILGQVTEDGSRLFANFSGDVEQGVTTGQLGGASSGGQTPAVIQSGRCTGPFETLP